MAAAPTVPPGTTGGTQFTHSLRPWARICGQHRAGASSVRGVFPLRCAQGGSKPRGSTLSSCVHLSYLEFHNPVREGQSERTGSPSAWLLPPTLGLSTGGFGVPGKQVACGSPETTSTVRLVVLADQVTTPVGSRPGSRCPGGKHPESRAPRDQGGAAPPRLLSRDRR